MKPSLPEFHPSTIIRDWGNGQAFTLADAQTGVIVFGSTGSGKTSGPSTHLGYGFLANGFGGLVLCAKKDERRQWQQWAADTGREDDLVIINSGGAWRYNFLECESSRPEEGGGLGINIVNMLNEISIAISGNDEGSSTGKFWEGSLNQLNTNAVDAVLLSGAEISLPLLSSFITTAALAPEQVLDPDWQTNSVCAQILAAAEKATASGDAEKRATYEVCRDYWLVEFPNLSEKTRSIVILMFSMLVRPLITHPLRKIFTTDTNIRPEDTFKGKIIIVDLPVQEFRLVGRIANLVWKYCFQIAVLRRVQPADRNNFLRPVFLWGDEFQNFVSKFDSEYQAVARSASGCTVYLTQNRESLRRVLKNNDAVDSLLGNLQCKIFCQNAGDTNEWAAKLLGERWVNVTSTNVGNSERDLVQQINAGNHSSGVTRSEQKRNFIEPARFTTLKRGGPQNDFQVEAIVYNGGHLFPNERTGELLPYILLTFNQK